MQEGTPRDTICVHAFDCCARFVVHSSAPKGICSMWLNAFVESVDLHPASFSLHHFRYNLNVNNFAGAEGGRVCENRGGSSVVCGSVPASCFFRFYCFYCCYCMCHSAYRSTPRLVAFSSCP